MKGIGSKMLGILAATAMMSGLPMGSLAGTGGPPPRKKDLPDRPKSDSSWVPYLELNFDDTTTAMYSIDTRDFHGTTADKFSGAMPWERKCEKNPDWYIHSGNEVVALLTRLKADSGGDVEWRFLELKGIFRTQNWKFKYIRIYRCYQGLLICNEDGFIFSKTDLKAPVNTEVLNAH